MRKILFLALICLAHFIGHAQDKWDLRRCVDYAVSNNISVKQTDVQARLAELTFKQYKLSQIPIVGFGGNIGYSSGQSQDPVTFALITAGLWSNQYFLQTSVNFFNFNSLSGELVSWHADCCSDGTGAGRCSKRTFFGVHFRSQ